MAPLRALYCDLDGTLLGRRASLLHDGEGAFTTAGVRALEACWRADVEVVLYSGRRRAQLAEAARLLGLSSFVYELGCAVCIDGDDVVLAGEWTHEAIARSGAVDLLLERFAGRLEYHTPWNLERDVSHLFRGLVDAFEASELLAAHGHESLRLVDNGVVHRRSAALADLPQVRVYHLVPAGASKGRAVATHMRARTYAPEDCIAVGDSREDLGASEHVGEFWLVANAVERDPTIMEAVGGRDNVRVAEESHGAGVYEAVVTTLAQRRG
jgi:phosphoglycolate phosphatase